MKRKLISVILIAVMLISVTVYCFSRYYNQ